MVEKSIISYGGVQTGLLEKGLSWIALFIALAPMLGFLGTVVGMIVAFDAIEIAGDISPSLVCLLYTSFPDLKCHKTICGLTGRAKR